MIILVALTVGLVWWIAAWAFGIKPFDAFLLTAAMVVGAAAIVPVAALRRPGRGVASRHASDRSGALF